MVRPACWAIPGNGTARVGRSWQLQARAHERFTQWHMTEGLAARYCLAETAGQLAYWEIPGFGTERAGLRLREQGRVRVRPMPWHMISPGQRQYSWAVCLPVAMN